MRVLRLRIRPFLYFEKEQVLYKCRVIDAKFIRSGVHVQATTVFNKADVHNRFHNMLLSIMYASTDDDAGCWPRYPDHGL